MSEVEGLLALFFIQAEEGNITGIVRAQLDRCELIFLVLIGLLAAQNQPGSIATPADIVGSRLCMKVGGATAA